MKVGFTYNMRRGNDPSESVDPASVSEIAPGIAGVDNFAEWDDEATVNDLRETLARHYDVIPVEATEDAFEKLRSSRPDLVFNVAEGAFGASRESVIPAMLEMLRIPYTGSDPVTLGLCLDKARAKEILSFRGLPTAKFSVLERWSLDGQLRNLKYPMFVKPLFEGSSKGIWMDALVSGTKELKEAVEKVWDVYRQPALVEEYLPGREFTVALLGNGTSLRVLPIVEITFDSLPEGAQPIYSYEPKWLWDSPEHQLDIYKCPTELDEPLRKRIECLCKKAFTSLGCRDLCRIDVRLDARGDPHILELNPLPGLIKDPSISSCFPKAARAAGMTFDKLILAIIDEACSRLGIPNEKKTSSHRL